MAEGAGFEPAVGVNLRTLSKRVPSSTQPPLRDAHCGGGASARQDFPVSSALLSLPAARFNGRANEYPRHAQMLLPILRRASGIPS